MGLHTALVRSVASLAAALPLVLSQGCDDASSGDDAGLDGGVDASEAGLPEGAIACTSDDACDDDVDCTRDTCEAEGYCAFRTDHSVCDDGVFCNGAEVCDLDLGGCAAGVRESCNDNDVCTVNVCDEASKSCLSSPRDFDGDGEADWHCDGGTDCDDTDPARNSTVAEICGDGVDNDCDEIVDEADCGRPPYDTCDDVLDVSDGGTFELTTDFAAPDYALECVGMGYRDLVLSLTLTEPKNVRVIAEADWFSSTVVAIRTACEDHDSEVDCVSGYPGELRRRNLGPGTYFLFVGASSPGSLVVEVTLDEPTPKPVNETCSFAVDLTGTWSADDSFVDVADDFSTDCGGTGAADLVYSFTTTATKDARITLDSISSETLSFAVRTDCGDEGTELRCARGSPASARLHELPAGTYYVLIEGSSWVEVDFSLDVELLDPTPAPVGDGCESPIALALETETDGTLVERADDHDSCGYYYPDTVYSFELTERRNVDVRVDSAGEYMTVSVRDVCASRSNDLRCESGNPAQVHLRDLAADVYYVLVESGAPTTYTITVETSTSTPVLPVSGNETCGSGSAYDVPGTGGVFSGDTTTMANDYETVWDCGGGAASPDAVFQLVLTSSKHVLVTTVESAFDTVLHMHTGSCTSGEETICDDDGAEGTRSLIETTLGVGTYYFVVDGYGTSTVGPYFVEFILSDP